MYIQIMLNDMIFRHLALDEISPFEFGGDRNLAINPPATFRS